MLEDDRMLNLAKLLDVASLRGQVHASNIANQNTPGYKAKAVRFEEKFMDALQHQGFAQARALEPEVYEPLDTMTDNDGNDVMVDKEVTAAAENTLLYRTYIQLLRGKHQIINQAIKPSGG